MERKNGEQRFIAADEDVFISFDGEDGLVIQTKMSTYRSYYSLLGWELLGPACQMIEVKVKREGQPTLFEKAASVSRDWRKRQEVIEVESAIVRSEVKVECGLCGRSIPVTGAHRIPVTDGKLDWNSEILVTICGQCYSDIMRSIAIIDDDGEV